MSEPVGGGLQYRLDPPAGTNRLPGLLFLWPGTKFAH